MQRPEGRPRVLVVDDKIEMADTLADGLFDRGYEAAACASSRQALARLQAEPFDALVTDLRMPGDDGLELLRAARRLDPHRPVIVMTAYGAVETAIESIRQGAYHYLTKPFKLDELVVFLGRALDEARVRHEASALRSALRDQFARKHLLGQGPAMRRVFALLDRVASTNAPVLLLGETGTGKGLVARTLHAESDRAAGPFVTLNCAALPEPLLESELFGHVKGAFTGASANHAGLFVEAHKGTLFLDEIGEMGLGLQAKLLDALERKVVRPVGASKERPVDVRVLAATHRNLRERVRAGAFREDLLYRLDVLSIELPPLRARPEDLPLLVNHFVAQMRERHPGSRLRSVARPALERMLAHAWPGNVRELAHVVERLAVLSAGEEAGLDDLPAAVRHGANAEAASGPFGPGVEPIREVERRYARWAYDQLGRNQVRTAERLGVDRKTLAKWLARDDEKAE
ncbi:MAG: sigma-54 dependent transcriptional regulator [Polyangiaceae bacterium]|nr:sigma-54 dependent transcriptional regulator [Polyangiaceae bacterium]